MSSALVGTYFFPGLVRTQVFFYCIMASANSITDQLDELKPTNKYVKTLIPVLASLFESYQFKQAEMLDSLKTDLVKTVSNLEVRVQALEEENGILKKKVEKLSERLEDSDQYELRDTVIISGSSVPAPQANENCSDIVKNLLQTHLNLILPANEISTAHRLGTRNTNSSRQTIIVKFSRRSWKNDTLQAARRMKASNFFVNEFLTPTQKTISYVLRKAKREFPNLISGSTTINGKNHVWVKPPRPGPNARDTKQQIFTRQRLEEFCSRVVNQPLSHFIELWPHD